MCHFLFAVNQSQQPLPTMSPPNQAPQQGFFLQQVPQQQLISPQQVPQQQQVLSTQQVPQQQVISPAQPNAPAGTYTLPWQQQVPVQMGSLLSDWMSSMPDDAPLAAVSIPGSHNSMARTGGPSLQSQTWDIGQQLRSGIRYLDVGFCLAGNEIVSKGVLQNPDTSIHEFMTPVKQFLTEHPRESVLVRIADVCAGGLDFYIRLHQTLNDHYGQYVLPLQIQNPRLGMSRGKMVIVKDYYGGPLGGLEYQSLDKTDGMMLASPEEKDIKPLTKAIKRHLKKVMTCGDFERMFLTVTSASGPGFTFQYAAAINEVLSFFLHKNPKGRIGIVAMDFPPEHVIGDIIARNFKRNK